MRLLRIEGLNPAEQFKFSDIPAGSIHVPGNYITGTPV